MKKVLAYLGSDLNGRNSIKFLRHASRRGYTLLALDSSAMAEATRSGVGYILIDDILGADETASALDKAALCERMWFHAAKAEFTVEEICWPEVDRPSMHWFWRDSMVALALAKAFQDLGCRDVAFFGNLLANPQIWSGRSDTWGRLWKKELAEKARELTILEPIRATYWLRAFSRMTRRIGVTPRGSPYSGNSRRMENLSGKIVFVMSYQESHRFGPILSTLSEAYPNQVGVVLTGNYPSLAQELSQQWSIPVLPGPPAPPSTLIPALAASIRLPIRSGLGRRFMEAYRRTARAAAGQAWEVPLRTLDFHFRYYALYRWPRLSDKVAGFWFRIWSRNLPKAVIGSTDESCEIRLAFKAAKRLGIPTVTIPHGVVESTSYPSKTSDVALYGVELQKQYYHKIRGVPVSRLKRCKGLIYREEYPNLRGSSYFTREDCRVLLLTNPTSPGTTLAPYLSLKAQAMALQQLCNVPGDLSSKVEMVIKVHPHYSDLDIIASAAPDLCERVLPRRADLHSVLQETDLVVGVNYEGSALAHALRAGKPSVVFLTLEKPLVERQCGHVNLFAGGITVVRSAAELWLLLRNFVNDSDTAEQMRLRAQGFASKHLSERGFPDLLDLLPELLVPKSRMFAPVKGDALEQPRSPAL